MLCASTLTDVAMYAHTSSFPVSALLAGNDQQAEFLLADKLLFAEVGPVAIDCSNHSHTELTFCNGDTP